MTPGRERCGGAPNVGGEALLNSPGFRISSEHTIREGHEQEFRRIIREAIEEMEREEPGTVEYGVYISEDGRYCQFNQRYSDVEAFNDHLEFDGHKLASLLEGHTDFQRSWLYDRPNERTRELIDRWGTGDSVVIGVQHVGFARDATGGPGE